MKKSRHEILEVLNRRVDTQSISEMIYEMNKLFLTKTNQQTDNQDISYIGLNETVKDQCLNVLDEIEELEVAITENDHKEIADALGDILTFGYGAMYILNPNSKEGLLANYQIKLDLSTVDNSIEQLSKTTSVLKSMFTSTDNTVGNIIEAIHFAATWAENLNIDLLSLMKGVTKSNYTKLMFSDVELDATTKHYSDLGVEKLYHIDSDMVIDGGVCTYSVIYSGADQLDNNKKQYRKDKFLKSIYFQDPENFVAFNELA